MAATSTSPRRSQPTSVRMHSGLVISLASVGSAWYGSPVQRKPWRSKRLGFDQERVALLMMSSQTYGRLGDQATAVRTAAECVEMAEQLGDPSLLADALNRLGNATASESPAQARAAYTRGL